MTPSSGTLDVGESMQVTVLFQPKTVGDHRQDLLLHYSTGEKTNFNLKKIRVIAALQAHYFTNF